MRQFAICRNEYGPGEWLSWVVAIVEGDINDAYHERDRIEREEGLHLVPFKVSQCSYSVRRLPRYIDPKSPMWQDEANRMLWPHRYGEGVA
jgi:hypothetical protein